MLPSSTRIAPFIDFPSNFSADLHTRVYQVYGLTDGEGIETAWAYQSPLLPSRIRSMPPGERRNRVDDYTFMVNPKAQLAALPGDDEDDEAMSELVESAEKMCARKVCAAACGIHLVWFFLRSGPRL